MCRKNAISDVHPQVTEIMQKGKKKKSYFVMVVSHPMMQNIIQGVLAFHDFTILDPHKFMIFFQASIS